MNLSSLIQTLREKTNKRLVIVAIGVSIVLVGVYFFLWIQKLSQIIDSQLEQKRFSPPLEFFAAPETLTKNLRFKDIQELATLLDKSGLKQKAAVSAFLNPLEFRVYTQEECASRFTGSSSDLNFCVEIKTTGDHALLELARNEEETSLIVQNIFMLPDFEEISYFNLEPVLFAQFYGKEPILRTRVELGDIPPICLNAILAIEDNRFLEHSGISVIGILRAFTKNLFAGRVVQGGSTITQQLVKNYFLTHEKTIARKFKEVFMALLIESKASKDDILEAYVNEIYMGQNSSFQIRGFQTASQYYFGKNLQELNLPECGLLAAIVNSPGLFNPFKNPDRARERRSLVLSKLLEEKNITQEEHDLAIKTPMPLAPNLLLSEPAPYFVDAVLRQLDEMGVDSTFGLRVETTLNIEAQEAAQKAVREGIDALENNNKVIQKIKNETRKNLEGFLVSADPKTGYIQAIVGGRSFKLSQYNRAIQSRRQVGSIMKPFVFYTALQAYDETDELYNPLTIINDEKFKIKFDKQQWAPQNYGNKYFGMIPMYFALKSSLNCATASLGIKVGLDSIADNARLAGIDTELEAYPSLTLGSFEVAPLEVLKSYTTFANLGEKTDLTLIRKIIDLDGEVLFEANVERTLALDPIDTSILVSMMKQTLLSGTGIYARLVGFNLPAAGKTGTTSDHKDSWFAGFTPYHVAVAWVGYDDNTETKLTGASGALPIWTQYMKNYATRYPADDFPWAEGTYKKTVSVEDQKAMNIPEEDKRPLEDAELIFRDQ